MPPQSYYIALLKSKKFTLHRKSFLKDLLRQGKDKIKQWKYGYCKLKYLPWLHYVGLKYSFAHETARENVSFSCFIDSYNSP